jgi:hypothetical protein
VTSDNVFDQMAAAGSILGVAMQIPSVAFELNDALASCDNNVDQAARDEDMLHVWTDAAPETRSALLLAAAWHARAADLAAGESTGAMYATDLHAYARSFTGDAEAFHGRGFPAMPLPGQAGALASSLGFDRDDVEISLETVLILQALATPAA